MGIFFFFSDQQCQTDINNITTTRTRLEMTKQQKCSFLFHTKLTFGSCNLLRKHGLQCYVTFFCFWNEGRHWTAKHGKRVFRRSPVKNQAANTFMDLNFHFRACSPSMLFVDLPPTWMSQVHWGKFDSSPRCLRTEIADDVCAVKSRTPCQGTFLCSQGLHGTRAWSRSRVDGLWAQ